MVLLILWVMLVFPVASHATTYYVSTTGSNSNDGMTVDTPWRTVVKAAATMVAGDTTYVRGGSYVETDYIRFGRTGTAAAPIKLLNYPGEKPIISCATPSTHFLLIQHYSGTNVAMGYLTLEGLEITSCFQGVKGYNIHNSTITRLWIHGNLYNGILVRGGHHNTYDHNIIEHNGFGDTGPAPHPHGMYISGDSITITNNLIYDNAGYGIQQNGWTTSYYDPTFHPSIDFAESRNWIIANNTFAYSHERAGIVQFGSRTGNARIENNIFYENATTESSSAVYGINYSSCCSTGNQYRNNHFYASSPGGTVAIGTAATEGVNYTQSGNVTNVSAPAFVTGGSGTLPGSPDFSLTAAAPVNIARANEFPNNSTMVVGAFKTVANPTASINTNKITLIFPMSTATPIQGLSTTGVSVACTGSACPGSPTVSSVSRVAGTDSHVEIAVSGITGDACEAANQAWTVSYSSATGAWTGNDNIGPYPGLHQKVFSFTNLAVTNACTGSGPSGYPAGYHLYYKFNEGTGTTANDESANNLDCTLTNSAGWGAGKTGTALSIATGTQQYCDVPWGSGVNPSTQSLTIFIPVYIETGTENALHYIGGPDLGTDQRAYICGENGVWKVSIQATTCQATAASNLAVTAGWNILTLRFDSGTDIATLYKEAVAGTGGASVSYTSFTFASNFKIGKLHTNAAKGNYLFDEFMVYLSLEDPATLSSAFNAEATPAVGTLTQDAIQFQGVILDASASPRVIGAAVQTIEVPAGGGVVLLFQVHCQNISDCAQTAFRLVYAKNGSAPFQHVPDVETADGVWMWGVTTEANLNNGARTARLTGSCAVTNGTTQVTSAQTPSVDLPQDGCTVLAYIIRVGATHAGDYYDFKLRTEANLDFTGGYTQTSRVRVVNPMASGVGF